MMTDDMTLLKEYVERDSEEALPRWCNGTSIWFIRWPCARPAMDICRRKLTQTVFVILARKASSLGANTILSGWLCRTARYASANALTIQHRRQRREQEAHMQSHLNESEHDTWAQIAPLLDNALEQLGEKDHNAIVLRYFEGKDLSRWARPWGWAKMPQRCVCIALSKNYGSFSISAESFRPEQLSRA